MMKKIYLIDDNSKGQQAAYGASFVQDGGYDDVLCHLEQVNKDFDVSTLAGAACIMIHDSLEDFVDGHFVETSHTAQDNIIQFAETNHIPYVCFSDGHEPMGEFDSASNLVRLKKSVFYARLTDFLDCYRSDGRIEFKVLAYGKNFQRYLLETMVKSLFLKFSGKQPTDTLTLADVMPKDRNEPAYLAQIIDLAQPTVGITYENLLDAIEDETLTVEVFKQQINQIFQSVSKYGKNTHTWQ
jgi:hypothetical protein